MNKVYTIPIYVYNEVGDEFPIEIAPLTFIGTLLEYYIPIIKTNRILFSIAGIEWESPNKKEYIDILDDAIHSATKININ